MSVLCGVFYNSAYLLTKPAKSLIFFKNQYASCGKTSDHKNEIICIFYIFIIQNQIPEKTILTEKL